ncbi:hypothetical protein M405DRAFT_846825 [Rhizopogon salebrosus TDB-379]|nr:hypothetical protein M405DRAFT_846825 [Rhizopogon salebrosus TDB-379]
MKMLDEEGIRRAMSGLGREGRKRAHFPRPQHPNNTRMRYPTPDLPPKIPQKHIRHRQLSPKLALRTLMEVSLKEVVRAGLVSKKWYIACHHPALWRWHCPRLTVDDAVRVRAPAKPEGW